MRVVEIGPGYSPIAPKREGWNTCTVDHTSRAELVAKYSSESDVDVSRIEDVDVIWTGGPLHKAMPAESHGSFDACIGSHVLEHIPDPIGLFMSLDRLLKPDGVISLAIPDKRFCFDFFRSLSSAGELLDAHRLKSSRHSLKNLFDSHAYSISSRGDICWGRRPVTDIEFLRPLEEAKHEYERHGTTEQDSYVDCHAWHFTPSCFELAILELGALGEIPFSIESAPPPEGCEFYVVLKRSPSRIVWNDELQSRRLELLTRTMREVREQTNFLFDAPGRDYGSGAKVLRLKRVATGLRGKIRAAVDRAYAHFDG